MNYWASATARDEVLESMVTNMDSDDYDSLAYTTSEGEDKMSRFEMKL